MSEITLGIIGGGQLGSMLSVAAKKLNIKTIIYSDDQHDWYAAIKSTHPEFYPIRLCNIWRYQWFYIWWTIISHIGELVS